MRFKNIPCGLNSLPVAQSAGHGWDKCAKKLVEKHIWLNPFASIASAKKSIKRISFVKTCLEEMPGHLEVDTLSGLLDPSS